MKSILWLSGKQLVPVVVGVSSLSDGMLFSVAPLLTLSITPDVGWVGVVSGCAILPFVALALPIGLLIDKIGARVAVRAANAGRLGLALLLAALVWSSLVSVAMLAALVFLMEGCRALLDTSCKSAVPKLFDEDERLQANQRMMLFQFMGDGIVGRALGGILFGISAPIVFVVYAASQLVSLVIGVGAFQEVEATRSVRSNLLAGIKWIYQSRLIGGLALFHGARSLANGLLSGILAVLVTKALGASSFVYGILVTALPVGGLAAVRLSKRVSTAAIGRVGVVLLAVDCGSYFAIALAGSVWLLYAPLACLAFSGVTWNVRTLTMRQELAPPDTVARVQATYSALQFGLLPVGALLGGAIAEYSSLTVAVVVPALFSMLLLMLFATAASTFSQSEETFMR